MPDTLSRIRYAVLLPPLLPLLGCAVVALREPVGLIAAAQGASDWVLAHFDWLFSWSCTAYLPLLLAVYLSPLGRTVIGGAGATRLLTPWRWFAVTACTTIATGILFWGIAEPIYHFSDPPPAGEENPAVFALSTLFLHWTLTPYAIYTVGGLLFALGFYSHGQPFSLSTLLRPLLGPRVHTHGGAIIDALCLFALVAGMAAALGAGSLALSGGLSGYFGGGATGATPGRLAVIIGVVVTAFSISAATGLQRGIRLLSNYNIIGFMLLAGFVFLAGPTLDTLRLAGGGLADYLATFWARNLGFDSGIPEAWSHAWTGFYWANWYAWAPITALFLGRLARGYTVRRFIEVNLLFTSLFGAGWMVAFGGTAVMIDGQGGGVLTTALTAGGPEAVAYALLAELPGLAVTALLFLLLVFLSYVTAADSNVSAMSALCMRDTGPASAEAPLGMKLLWGATIGLTAWVLVSYAGLDGIRLISTLGGFPAMLLFLLGAVGLGRLAWKSWRGATNGATNRKL
ncbi:choline-glycine betaine transporter [Lewinella marina]|uniref:BCCT transporter n=1 Tax=Neolewinella marina TaxID=438751 RepID=A0A2G0CHD8_9BACT|nr:BCCT family transporter [Neolewinella marina]NJB86130.1 choline-glycine betaine transporter [Neolewinella marina]PHK99392.1 BCCT transporter [Neolewinella marina]